MDTREIIILWREGAWRCEFHPGFGGESRLLVYRGEQVAAAESTPTGEPAFRRADALRQRVIRGDIS